MAYQQHTISHSADSSFTKMDHDNEVLTTQPLLQSGMQRINLDDDPEQKNKQTFLRGTGTEDIAVSLSYQFHSVQSLSKMKPKCSLRRSEYPFSSVVSRRLIIITSASTALCCFECYWLVRWIPHCCYWSNWDCDCGGCDCSGCSCDCGGF